jgi:hypothetical protein
VLDNQLMGHLDHAQAVHVSGQQVVEDAHVRADGGVSHDQALNLFMNGDSGDEAAGFPGEPQELIAPCQKACICVLFDLGTTQKHPELGGPVRSHAGVGQC